MSTSFKNVTPTGPGGTATLLIVLSFTGFLLLTQSLFVVPSGPVYQAGTLSGNPLAMTAGIKTLELLKQEGTYEKLDAITSRLIEGVIQSAENNGIAINGGSVSAMFGFFLCDGPVRNFDEAKTNDAELFGKLHSCLLYTSPSPRDPL